MNRRFLRQALLPLLVSLWLAACGGNGDGGSGTTAAPALTQPPASPAASVNAAAGAPQSTGNTATDGYNWFNFRRQQAGLSPFVRNSVIDAAAQAHSEYQKTNNIITHEQTAGKTGFTGVNTGNRLMNAGYTGPLAAYGEVISSTGNASGFNAAEDLITAIYHRFVILEPVFRLGGTGAATTGGGTTYFTADFVASNLNGGLGPGKIVVYPFDGQTAVPRNFFSDNEVPDPVLAKNEVGYPVSVHADITSRVAVRNFTIQPRGGLALQVRQLDHGSDAETPASAAAIIPLSPLTSGATYDVVFEGTVDGAAVSRKWSFTVQ